MSFPEAVTAAGARYLEVDGWDEVIDHVRRRRATSAGAAGGAAASRAAVGDVEVVALAPSLAARRPELLDRCRTAGLHVVVPDGDDPAAQVADVPIGMVEAELAVAETGSVLIAEHALGDRVVTMLCRTLVQLVVADTIVDRLEGAADRLRRRGGEPGFASLMTGPSRTADIERSLTIGVQGPDEVEVVVLTATSDTAVCGGVDDA